MKKNTLAVLVCGLAAALFSATAEAQSGTFTGKLYFVGNATLSPPGSTLANATGVSAWSGSAAGGLPLAVDATGSFAPMVGQGVILTAPYNFNGGVVAPLWSVSNGALTITFDLISSVIITQTSSFLLVAGTGVLHGGDFTPTFARWSLAFYPDGSFEGGTSRSSASPLPDDVNTAEMLTAAMLLLVCALRFRRQVA